MERDDVDLVPLQPAHLAVPVGDVAVRGAVEAVPANLVTAVELVRDAVQECGLRHRRVKRGVEDGDLRDAGPQKVRRRADALDVRGVVERREVGALLDPGEHVWIDLDRHLELLAPVNDSVPRRVNVGHRSEAFEARLCRDEPSQEDVDRRAVVPERRIALDRRPPRRPEGDQRVAPDPLDEPARDLSIGVPLDDVEVGLDELETNGGRAAVEDENVHARVPGAPGTAPQRAASVVREPRRSSASARSQSSR